MTYEQECITQMLELTNDLEKLQAADLIRDLDDQIETMKRHEAARKTNDNGFLLSQALRFIKKWSRHDSHCGLAYGKNECTCGFWDEMHELKQQIEDPKPQAKPEENLPSPVSLKASR
jgi:hypothetical protein